MNYNMIYFKLIKMKDILNSTCYYRIYIKNKEYKNYIQFGIGRNKHEIIKVLKEGYPGCVIASNFFGKIRVCFIDIKNFFVYLSKKIF